ncbi:MAG: uroporphyrinogen decarboxylase family protein [Caldilineaceae bacterium]
MQTVLPELIDAGMDCFNTVQTDAADMDAMELKKRFGKQITFWGGGVDTHRVLPFGTPEQVREDVRRRIQIFGPGGGYVFASIHNMLGDVPPQNILAAVDAIVEFGDYPIQTQGEDREELAKRLTESNYWAKPLEAMKNEVNA